jgi:hypothetical protein
LLRKRVVDAPPSLVYWRWNAARIDQTVGGRQQGMRCGKHRPDSESIDVEERSVPMDVTSYCDRLEQYLTNWKSKIYDVIRIVDRLPNGEKEAVFPSIRSLHAVVDEIDQQMEMLRSACPADWSPNRKNIDQKMVELHQTLRKLSERVGGPLIPDSLSWVSE